MHAHDDARTALASWREAASRNYFDEDAFLHAVLHRHLGRPAFERERAGWSAFGAACAGPLDEMVRETNRDEHLPRLRRYDDHGRRIDQVIFHPAYTAIGEAVYATGIIARYAQPGEELCQMVYGYLLCHLGEAGHMCPVACTAGLVKILQQQGDPALQARWLPGLLRRDRAHPEHLHGAQWLTEIQGGSDVGANACVARQDEAGAWRVFGEKWFCSVIDADLAVVTARPEGPGWGGRGTAGLATFVVPRLVDDGRPNEIHVRRLKNKLGTRSMASAEIDLQGALTFPVGPLQGAFGRTVEIVLGTSRLQNAVAACGELRRAEMEATTYARARQAFGAPVDRFPSMQRTLGRIRATARGAVASTFDLLAVADRIARGQATPDEVAFHRMGTSANKFYTALRCTHTLRDAIEVLGGNGAIEDFSVLPRLLRDSIVMENWEGTHDVLCAQILKDIQRLRVHEGFLCRLGERLGHLPPGPTRDALAERLAAEAAGLDELATLAPEAASLAVRPRVVSVMQLWQALGVVEAGASAGLADVDADAARLLALPVGDGA